MCLTSRTPQDAPWLAAGALSHDHSHLAASAARSGPGLGARCTPRVAPDWFVLVLHSCWFDGWLAWLLLLFQVRCSTTLSLISIYLHVRNMNTFDPCMAIRSTRWMWGSTKHTQE